MHHEFVHNDKEFVLVSTFSYATYACFNECARSRSYRSKDVITFLEATPLTGTIGVSGRWSYENTQFGTSGQLEWDSGPNCRLRAYNIW